MYLQIQKRLSPVKITPMSSDTSQSSETRITYNSTFGTDSNTNRTNSVRIYSLLCGSVDL